MVRHLTLATAAMPEPAPPLPPTSPAPAQAGDAAAQLDAFWRHMRLKTAVYLAQGHGLPRPQAVERARAVVAAVRETTEVPDREAVLSRCLEEAAALMAAGPGGPGARPTARPVPLPVAGLPMDPQPLAPVLVAPSPMADAVRLWGMAAAAMVVPALAAFAALALT